MSPGGSGTRVIAGELGGRRLRTPRPGQEGRPTTDRVREALFSILGALDEERVLDLYCGTGALAIEALSRGAGSAVLVDTDPGLARANLGELGLDRRAEVVRSDALRFLARAGDRFDLVFCDPPYRLARRLGPELDRLLPARLEEGARVITESAAGEPIEVALPLLDERRYGSTAIRIHGARR